MPTTNMLVMCDQTYDEDGMYFTISTTEGSKRVFYIEDGEQATDGFCQYLPVQAFGKKGNNIAIKFTSDDPRSRNTIYRVPLDQVISVSDFKELVAHR